MKLGIKLTSHSCYLKVKKNSPKLAISPMLATVLQSTSSLDDSMKYYEVKITRNDRAIHTNYVKSKTVLYILIDHSWRPLYNGLYYINNRLIRNA